jgi:hypothetical protein
MSANSEVANYSPAGMKQHLILNEMKINDPDGYRVMRQIATSKQQVSRAEIREKDPEAYRIKVRDYTRKYRAQCKAAAAPAAVAGTVAAPALADLAAGIPAFVFIKNIDTVSLPTRQRLEANRNRNKAREMIGIYRAQCLTASAAADLEKLSSISAAADIENLSSSISAIDIINTENICR